MNTMLRKFLIVGTAFCLSVAPALSRIRGNDGTAAGIDADTQENAIRDNVRPSPAAHIGEIDTDDIDIYQKQMHSAISITDPGRRDVAITSARQRLAQNIGKPLKAGTIAELDGILDIGGASPQLGHLGNLDLSGVGLGRVSHLRWISRTGAGTFSESRRRELKF
jgi:hypothetical protein